MFLAINKLLERATLWVLRNGDKPINMQKTVLHFQASIHELASSLGAVVPKIYKEEIATRAKVYMDDGTPKELAHAVAGLVNLASGLDIVVLAEQRKLNVCEVATLYYAMGLRFHLGLLRRECEALEGETHWQKLAVSALVEELFSHQVQLTGLALDKANGSKELTKALAAWADDNTDAIDRTEQLLGELWAGDISDISMVAVASRAFKSLADECSNRSA